MALYKYFIVSAAFSAISVKCTNESSSYFGQFDDFTTIQTAYVLLTLEMYTNEISGINSKAPLLTENICRHAQYIQQIYEKLKKASTEVAQFLSNPRMTTSVESIMYKILANYPHLVNGIKEIDLIHEDSRNIINRSTTAQSRNYETGLKDLYWTMFRGPYGSIPNILAANYLILVNQTAPTWSASLKAAVANETEALKDLPLFFVATEIKGYITIVHGYLAHRMVREGLLSERLIKYQFDSLQRIKIYLQLIARQN